MKPVRIIGTGSPFGQDQTGWYVLESIQRQLEDELSLQDIECIRTDRPGLHLLELMKNAQTVVLIDAIAEPRLAGKLLELDDTQIASHDSLMSSHAIGVSEALALGKKLAALPDQLVLFGLCIDPEQPGEFDNQTITHFAKTIVNKLKKLHDVTHAD